MSRERDKQADEALAAIRKLVEGEDNRPLMLTNMMVSAHLIRWCGEQKLQDKAPFDEPASADVPAILMPEEAVVQKPLKAPAPHTSDLSKPVAKITNDKNYQPSGCRNGHWQVLVA